MPDQWPALVVMNGPQAGQCFTVRGEYARVGRSPDANIRLDSIDVSRQHLRVSRNGGDLLVEDLGSSNGTYINGTRLAGTGFAKPGDRLHVGDIELQYVVLGSSVAPNAAPAAYSYDFGGVNGPVNTGNPVNHSGNQIVGTGNIHHGDRYDIQAGPDDGTQELFSGQGPGRVLIGIGLVVAMVGFALFASVILSMFASPNGGLDGPSPFEKEVFGLNATVTGFVMFAVGAVVTRLGAGMSRAARQRGERRR